MILTITIIALVAIIVLWIIGGLWKGSIRKVPVPFIIGIVIGLQYKDFWLGFWTAGAYQMIRRGYGNYDPENDPEPSFLARITHDRNGWWIRAIWGLLVGTCGALFMKLWVPEFGWIEYLLYIFVVSAASFLASFLHIPGLKYIPFLKKADAIFDDTLVSAAVASIMFAGYLPF